MDKTKKVAISKEDLAKALEALIREDIIAACVKENSSLLLHFLSGQEYKITIEEITKN